MITLEEITGGEAEGRGFYDELMRTMSSQLQREFTESRIVGPEYAQAYIALLQTALPVAANVVLQYHLNNKQLEILEEQRKNAELNNDLIRAQIRKIDEEILVSVYQRTELMPLQKEQLQEQIDLLQSQDLGQLAQNRLIAANEAGQIQQTANLVKQGVLIDAQVATEQTNTVDATGGLAKAQLDKSTAEVCVITQKCKTEKAQTEGDPTTIKGLVGAEIKLKTAQGDSFIRDAEQKTAKFFTDVLSVVYSSDPAGEFSNPNLWGFGAADAAKVSDKLLEGIGVAP